jgi:cytoskeletal protein CcmA (bactofilin family)
MATFTTCSKLLEKIPVTLALLLLITFTLIGAKKRDKGKKEAHRTEKTSHVSGQAYYSHDTLAHVTVRGRVILDQVRVEGPVTIQGNATIKKSHLKGRLTLQGRASLKNVKVGGHSKIQGRVTLENVCFKDEVAVRGKIEAHHTEFKATLTAAVSEMTLDHVTAQALYIEKTISKCCSGLFFKTCKECQKPPVITLTGKTVIQGPITFESKDGIVRIGKEAILQGEVIGGTLQPLS